MLSRASHQVTNRLRIGVCSGEVWVERPAGDDGFEGGQQRHALFSKGGKVASEARERICAPLGAEAARHLLLHLEHATVAPASFDACYNLGLALNQLRRYDDALPAHMRALALTPDNAAAWHNEAVALRGLQRNEEALVAAQRAVAIAPSDAAYHNDLGYILMKLQRYDEALAEIDCALEIRPNFVLAWHNRVYPLRMLGRELEAKQADERVRTLGA